MVCSDHQFLSNPNRSKFEKKLCAIGGWFSQNWSVSKFLSWTHHVVEFFVGFQKNIKLLKLDKQNSSYGLLKIYIVLPYWYVYRYPSSCRIFHRGVDKQSISAYPRLTFCHYRIVNKCQVCKSAPSWVTVNDELAISSPCHFCEDCFTKLHYTKEGTKIANFEAYPFHPASH